MPAASRRSGFTDAYVRSLKPRETRYEVIEPTRSGLRLRISPTGRKIWVFVFRQHRRLYRKTIGPYPAVSVADAHAEVANDRLLLDKKLNPVTLAKEERRQALLQEQRDPTLESLCTIYIERYAKVNKRTWREDQRILSKDVLPRWRDLRVSQIERAHIVTLLDDLVARGSGVGANRTFATIRKMFNFAIARALIERSPCQGIAKPVKEQARQVVLSDVEIGRIWRGLGELPVTPTVRTALYVLLATAQRPGEVAGMRWSELDDDCRWWTIPPERAKNKLQHRIPISPFVRAMLRAVERSQDSDFVFRSRLGDRAINTSALDNVMRLHRVALGFDANRKITPHDLRRTAASRMTEVGVARLTVGKILNHAESGVTAVYDRHSYDPEKRAALLRWQLRLRRAVRAKAVESESTPLRRAA